MNNSQLESASQRMQQAVWDPLQRQHTCTSSESSLMLHVSMMPRFGCNILSEVHSSFLPAACMSTVLAQILMACVQGRREVFQELKKEHPSMKLLYTTPEQLQGSEGLVECLHDLCNRCHPTPPVRLCACFSLHSLLCVVGLLLHRTCFGGACSAPACSTQTLCGCASNL